jgi:hypothetical protein
MRQFTQLRCDFGHGQIPPNTPQDGLGVEWSQVKSCQPDKEKCALNCDDDGLTRARARAVIADLGTTRVLLMYVVGVCSGD